MAAMTKQKLNDKKSKMNEKQKETIRLLRFCKYVFLVIGFAGIGLIINQVIYLSFLPWIRATTWDATRNFGILLISFFSFGCFCYLDKKLKMDERQNEIKRELSSFYERG